MSEKVFSYLHQVFEIIGCLDANKNVTSGRIGSKFKSLGSIDTAGLFASDTAPPTHIRVRYQLDAVQESPVIAPSTSSIDPFCFGLGDHRNFIINLSSDLLLGDKFVPLVKRSMRRIISSQP